MQDRVRPCETPSAMALTNRGSARFDVTTCLLAVACSHWPPANDIAAPPQLPPSTATAPREGATASPSKTESEPLPRNAGAPTPRVPPPLRVRSPDAVDLASWLDARDVRVRDPILENLDTYECVPVVVGIPPRDGLLCRDGVAAEGSRADGFDVFVAIIAIADHGRLRTVLRVPFAAGPEDLEGDMSRQSADYVRLDVEVAGKGRVVTIRDTPEGRCGEIIRKHVEDPRYQAVVRRACSGTGRYEWARQRFVRVTPGCGRTRRPGVNPVAAVCDGNERDCRCPDYASHCEGQGRASLVALGSFTGRYREALVTFEASGPYATWTGTVLVRNTRKGWLPVGHLSDVVLKGCSKRRGKDGLDRLACREGDGAYVTGAVVLDIGHEHYDELISGLCEQGRVVQGVDWLPGSSSFDVQVTFEHAGRHENTGEACRRASGEAAMAKLSYRLRPEGYVPGSRTLALLRTIDSTSVTSDPGGNTAVAPDPGAPTDPYLLPRRSLLQFTEVPACIY
jgi:hypothetical protein